MKKITQLAIIPILVADQDEALRFFTEKLELEKRTDVMYGPDMRWLTVTPPDQPEMELTLLPVVEGMMFDKESAEQLRSLVKKGKIGPGVFECLAILGKDETLRRINTAPLAG